MGHLRRLCWPPIALGLCACTSTLEGASADVWQHGDQRALEAGLRPLEAGAEGLSSRPDASPDRLQSVPGRLPADQLPALQFAAGSGLAGGVVSGRIYADLAANAPARLRDLAALGVRVLRIEIERDTPWSQYQTLATAAAAAGIELLALISAQSTAAGTPKPMAGDRAAFDATFVPAFLAALDATLAKLPTVRFVEVWNEPDVYEFQPMYSWSAAAGCGALEGAYRYPLLVTRVFETIHQRRLAGKPTPQVVGFDVSRGDDSCLRGVLFDSEPVQNHRKYYRPARGLADGLPVDIVSLHGYGNAGKAPWETGYTYAGGTFADGVDAILGSTFADGKAVFAATPLWLTEVGYGLNTFAGRADPAATQRDAVTSVFATLAARPKVTAAFWYDYRDDEPGPGSEGNSCGLRYPSTKGFAAHPAYEAYQAATSKALDRTPPAGELEAPQPGAHGQAGAQLAVSGWAIDADGQPPQIELAVDGKVVATVSDGSAPSSKACVTAHSARCPAVGFAAKVTLPAAPGPHEVAARARDAAGNARVLGRADVVVDP